MYPKRNVYTQWRRISCFIVLMGGLNQPLRQTNRAIKRLRRVKIYFLQGEKALSAEIEIFFTKRMIFVGMKQVMRQMKKSLRQEIFCLRKIERFLSDHSPPQTELLGGSHQEQEDHGKFCRHKLWTYFQLYIVP